MPSQQTNEFQFLLKVVGYLRTHWWLFALEICVVFAIWMTKYYRTPNVYDSTAEILIDSTTRQMYQSVFSAATRSDSRAQNMASILQSPEVMDQFSERFTEHFFKEGKPNHLKAFFPSGQIFPSSQFLEWITLQWNKVNDIYTLRCVAPNPDAAHDLCQTYLDTIQDAYPQYGQRGVQNKRDFLSRQIASLHRQIVDREMSMAEFEKDNTEYVNFRTAVIENQSLQALRNRTRELSQKIKLNRSIAALIQNAQTNTPVTRENYDATERSLSKQLNELIYRRHLTEQDTTEDKVDRLIQIRKDIESIQAQLQTIRERARTDSPTLHNGAQAATMLADLDLQFRVSLIKLKNLKSEIFDIEVQKSKYHQVDLEFNRLKSELSHKNRLLANLYKREQDAEIELSAVRSEIFKLRRPTRSGYRIAPQLSKFVFAAISLSMLVIIATALLLTIFFPRLDSESDIAKLNLPILGKIPSLREWLTKSNTLSPFALEYLKIMSYRILRETKEVKCPTIVVTSPQSGEGKSTVTYFLSMASQSPGRKVLFVDGDLITNHFNNFFGIDENATGGLKALMATENRPNPMDLIVKTEHEGVYFLPRGGQVDSVSSPDFLKPIAEVLNSLKSEFDTIYIDTPPLFASSLAHQWAGIGDLTVLVARMFATRPKDLVEGLQTCKIFSKAPVGVALNCLPMNRNQSRGSYYYYFSRYYPRRAQKAA